MGEFIDKVAAWMMGIGLANIVAFMIGAGIIGGDSRPSKPGETGYYVSNRGHRREVSALVWHYSSLHKSAVRITTPPLMLGGLFLVWRRSLKQTKKPETPRPMHLKRNSPA
jgi:hypothetical protein